MLRDRDMELEVGCWSGTMHAFDDEGRLFGEEFGLGPDRTELPDTEWRTWKAAGSRQGRLYNLTAMRSVSRHWVHLQSDARLLQQRYLARFGSSGTLADLYHLAQTATAIPAYLMRRRLGRLRDGRVPARYAALFKAAAGIHLTIDAMMARDESVEAFERPRPRQMLEYIEANHIFVAATGRVCAGPEKMVEALFACVLGCSPQADLPAVDPPLFASELDRVLDYGVAAARLELAHRMFAAEHSRWVDLLEDAFSGAAARTGADAERPAHGARMASRIFDHLTALDGTSARSFSPHCAPCEAAAALERRLRTDFGLESEAVCRTVSRWLLARARAHRAFCALFEQASVALGRKVDPLPRWSKVEARMSRGKTVAPSAARALLASLPLAQRGTELCLRAPAGGLVVIPTNP